MSGRGGGDSLEGNGGNDTPAGRDGGDSLDGNQGDDVIDGGYGDDRADGGPGTGTCINAENCVLLLVLDADSARGGSWRLPPADGPAA